MSGTFQLGRALALPAGRGSGVERRRRFDAQCDHRLCGGLAGAHVFLLRHVGAALNRRSILLTPAGRIWLQFIFATVKSNCGAADAGGRPTPIPVDRSHSDSRAGIGTSEAPQARRVPRETARLILSIGFAAPTTPGDQVELQPACSRRHAEARRQPRRGSRSRIGVRAIPCS
jgi:hypothetical protein